MDSFETGGFPMATNARRPTSGQVGDTTKQAGDKAQQAGSGVQNSPAFRMLVTLGLICYGVIHVLLGWLAIQLALGGGGEASTGGAMKDLVSKPLGEVLMVVIAVGLFALALWQLIEALFGYQNLKTTKKVRRKISSGAKVIMYSALAVSAIALATGGDSGNSNESAQSTTARLMSAPFGQLLVGLVGLGIIAVGISQIVKGIRRKFVERDLDGAAPEWGKKLGTVGWIAKGLSIALVGALFLWAAISHDPQKAGGVDGALKTLLEQPFGVVLLIAMGLGFAAFGIYCFVWSRHVNHEEI